jgi:hypothetical protein
MPSRLRRRTRLELLVLAASATLVCVALLVYVRRTWVLLDLAKIQDRAIAKALENQELMISRQREILDAVGGK